MSKRSTARRLACVVATAALVGGGLTAASTASTGSTDSIRPASAQPAAPAGDGAADGVGEQALAQTLTWTADNSTTAYKSAPTEAVAGPTTIVFENSAATGNTSGMQHTLTFDTAGGEYNDDVDLDILAFPSDENDGRWEVDVTLTEGTYRYRCNIPGHGQMVGELVVTGGGGGGEDTTAPEVSASIAGETDADGAYIGAATITLDATDEGGVASTEYQVDDLGWQPYTAPVVVDEIGDHTIGYRATDVAGNASAEGNDPFSVVAADGPDQTPPEVTAMVHGETNEAGEYLGAAQVMLSATDAQSGVASIEYALDGGEWTTYTDMVEVADVGEHTISYRATDVAGNVSEPAEQAFTVAQAPDDDTSPPVATAAVAGEQDASWEYVGAVTVTLAATDEGAGVDRVEYLLDDGDWEEYGEPLEVTDAGAHTLQYRAHDLGGNVSEVGTAGFTIAADVVAPTCAEPDPSPTVVMGAIGSGVRNRVADDGTCTIDDQIRDEAGWSSHASFLVHVRSVLAGLLADGIVTGAERSKILAAATRSDVGRS